MNTSIPWKSFTIAGLCLSLGLGVTIYIFDYLAAADNERIQDRLLRGIQVLASTAASNPIDPDIPLAYDVLNSLSEQLTAGADISENLLNAALWESNRGISNGLRYMPLTKFNSASNKYQWQGNNGAVHDIDFDLNYYSDGGQIQPLPARYAGELFPIVMASKGSILINVFGLDYMSNKTFHFAMDQARDTGTFATRISFPRYTDSQANIFYFIFLPLYSGTSVPASVSERRARHIGFVSATLVVRASYSLYNLPDSFQGMNVVFFRRADGMQPDILDKDFQQLLSSGSFVEASYQANAANGDGNVYLVGQAARGQILDMQRNDKWWALAIGLLLSVWMSTQIFFYSSSSSRLRRQVDERTADLAERSARLKDLNEALQKSERLYRTVTSNVSDIICSLDSEGLCTYVSPSVELQLGYAASDLLGRSFFELLDSESATSFKTLASYYGNNPDQLVQAGIATLNMRSKSGAIRIMECKISAIADNPDLKSGLLLALRDVTARQLAEDEKNRLTQAMQHSQKMQAIGTLAGGISHDFNNLLAGVLGHAELMRFNLYDRKSLSDSIKVIETAALRGKELTTQLLSFARKGEVRKVPVRINALVQETVDLMKHVIDKNVVVSCICDPANPVVNGDSGQISQILVNLSVNARDAMPEGGALEFRTSTIVLASEDQILHLAAGSYCLIQVHDTGKGIARAEMDRIFEPFYTSKDEGKGTGLGLAMVYSACKNHEGAIAVESEVGTGTVFNVFLPLSNLDASQVAPLTDTELPTGNGLVLIIDDEIVLCNMATRMLNMLGYKTLIATDGKQGVDMFRQHSAEIDLVILDMLMPLMGGAECLKYLRGHDPQVQVILATGYLPDSVDLQNYSANVACILKKPYLLKELSVQVSKFVGLRRSAAAQTPA